MNHWYIPKIMKQCLEYYAIGKTASVRVKPRLRHRINLLYVDFLFELGTITSSWVKVKSRVGSNVARFNVEA